MRNSSPDWGASPQLGFDFGPPPAPPGGGSDDGGGRDGDDVFFFAVRPPPNDELGLTDLSRRLVRTDGLTARSLAARRHHISLVGWRPSTYMPGLEIAREIGRRIVWPTFEIALTAAMSFGRSGSRPVVLGCSPGSAWALTGLHDCLLEVAAACGLQLRPRSTFEPHLTLAYSTSGVAERMLDAPVRWMARELVLIRSERGRGRHTELGRWPFRPAASKG